MSAEKIETIPIGALVVTPDGRLMAQLRPDLAGLEAVMTAIQAANLFTQIALQEAAKMQSKVVRPRILRPA